MTSAAPANHFGSLQTLRCVAAVIVVIAHAPGALRRAGYQSVGTWHAANGAVDVFFVLSGLVITSAVGTRTRTTRSAFVVRRAIRIVPLALAAALLATVTLRPFDAAMLVRSILFLPTEAATDGRFTSSYSAAWTVGYEAFFYLCFAALLRFEAARRTLAIVGLTAALVAVGLVLGDRATGLLDFYTDPIILEFAAGVALVHVVVERDWKRVPAAAIAAAHLAAWGILLLVVRTGRDELGDWRVLAGGLPAIVIVATAVMLERRSRFPRVRAIERLGDSSYGLYMSHLFVVAVGGELWRVAGLTDRLDRGVLVVVVLVASVIVGEAVDRLFDRPIRKVLASRLLGRPPSLVAHGGVS